MLVKIITKEFDPWLELSQYQAHNISSACGACAAFVGTMRDFNQDARVHSMTLEHYPGMAQKQLELILGENIERHQLIDALVLHRVGLIQPSENIVLVAAFSSHRKQAFDACRKIMEDLKHKAPFWKREQLDNSERWVHENV